MKQRENTVPGDSYKVLLQLVLTDERFCVFMSRTLSQHGMTAKEDPKHQPWPKCGEFCHYILMKLRNALYIGSDERLTYQKLKP